MTVFEFLTENHSIINTLSRCGIIGVHIPSHYALYSKYLHLKSRYVNKNEMYKIIKSEFKYSSKQIWVIIKEMESTI